jgi:hypothetical protein
MSTSTDILGFNPVGEEVLHRLLAGFVRLSELLYDNLLCTTTASQHGVPRPSAIVALRFYELLRDLVYENMTVRLGDRLVTNITTAGDG